MCICIEYFSTTNKKKDNAQQLNQSLLLHINFIHYNSNRDFHKKYSPMEIRKNFQHEGFSLMNSNSSLKIFLLPSKFNAQYSNFHLRIHDPHFLTITLNFYKFHNTNGNRHTFQSNLNFYRNLWNPLRLNHGIFHPLSFSLYFSHISKFHSIPLKISKTQIGNGLDYNLRVVSTISHPFRSLFRNSCVSPLFF